MIAENLAAVRTNIDAARARRTSVSGGEDVLLVAVTKNHPAAAVREAIAAGIKDVGENRVQEALQKQAEIGAADVRWHLIGHLQTNKARQAVQHFQLIHSVDTEHLAVALDKEAGKIGKVQDILVQVNLAKEESKSGFYHEHLQSALEHIDAMENLRIMGLMCMAPNYEDVEQCRPLFRKMHDIYRRVQEMAWRAANIKYLSMGMTHDYEIAVEEGSNIVRVGTAIFGPREY